MKEPLFLPTITLERESTVPLHRQIHRQIADAVRGHEIHSGARLPSTRRMATLLGVSRNTVLAAYDDLAADDLIRGKHGSGVRITAGAPFPEVSMFALRRVMREANYPAKAVVIADGDGNPMYLNF